MSVEPELLLAYADGEASSEEAELVEAALRDSPERRAEYARLVRQRLMLAEVLAAEAGPVVLLPAGEQSKAEVPARSRLWRGVQIAAALAAAVLLAVGAWWLFSKPEPAGHIVSEGVRVAEAAPVVYGQPLEAPAGKALQVVLADESVVTVAAAARVRVPRRRRLELESGQVRVACRKDPEKQFVVTAGEARVTAVGTEFTVEIVEISDGVPEAAARKPRIRDDQEKELAMGKVVRVVVFSGIVILANQLGEVRLFAGEKGEGREGAKPAKVEGGDKHKKDKKEKKEKKNKGHGLGKEGTFKLGKFVQEKLAEGLRGKELAEAIRKKIDELKAIKDARKDAKREGKKHGKGKGKGKKDGPPDADGDKHDGDKGDRHDGDKHDGDKGDKDDGERGGKKDKGRGRGKGDKEGKGRGHGKRDGVEPDFNVF